SPSSGTCKPTTSVSGPCGPKAHKRKSGEGRRFTNGSIQLPQGGSRPVRSLPLSAAQPGGREGQAGEQLARLSGAHQLLLLQRKEQFFSRMSSTCSRRRDWRPDNLPGRAIAVKTTHRGRAPRHKLEVQ